MLWIKAFHIFFVSSWMAGLFYLPRIFVHYAEGRQKGEDVRRLVKMAGNLMAFSSVVGFTALCLGLALWLGFGVSGDWLKLKLAFVACVIGYHALCFLFVRKILAGTLRKGPLFFRFFNEALLVIVIPVFILAVVKPF